MDHLIQAIAAGEYARAYAALQGLPEAGTPVGIASSAFLLALLERFDEAERLLRTTNAPMIELVVRGERARVARWSNPAAAGSLQAAEPLPFLGVYAGMAVALLQGDVALVERIKRDMVAHVRPVGGRLHLSGGRVRPFDDIVDSDDAIGQMLETYCDGGLLYFPFAALRRIDFLPPRNFIDGLARKAQLVDQKGESVSAIVPFLYAGSATSDDPHERSGRETTFNYVGAGRRARGQRDFCVDGALVALQNVVAVEFA